MDSRQIAPPPADRQILESPAAERSDALGIVIADGGRGQRMRSRVPVVRAFIYGEPAEPPTVQFARWKEAP